MTEPTAPEQSTPEPTTPEPTTSRTTDWMRDYLAAWASNEPADIAALFTDDARYYTEPYSPPWSGSEGIVEGWLAAADAPGSVDFEWAPLTETRDLAVVQGTTRYTDGPVYSNLWVIRFAADGRAREFTEWWMEHSPSTGTD